MGIELESKVNVESKDKVEANVGIAVEIKADVGIIFETARESRTSAIPRR